MSKFIHLICSFLLFQGVYTQSPLQWTLHKKGENERYFLGEKGSVQEALIQAAVLPSPFYGTNEEKFGWIENEDWIFESEFEITPEQWEKENILLHFESIDTYAFLYINDVLYNTRPFNNAFTPKYLTIKNKVRLGKNKLRLHFVSPINYHKETYTNLQVKFPTPNDANDSIQVSSMTRKPQFQFGWDWSLRMNTIGLNAPAHIIAYDENKVILTSTQTLKIEEDIAYMKMYFRTANLCALSDNIEIKSSLFSVDSIRRINDVEHAIFFRIQQPKLYWPNGWGEQHFYKGALEIYQNSQLIHRDEHYQFGIATQQLVREADEFGTSYEIHWNNQLIFCKGGNYVPQDVFLSSVNEERMKQLIDDCVAANFNMIRVWGGGYYLPDFFYQYCAEKGILIWQDFMFACALYPGDQDFLWNVQTEISHHIPRIANFPNIALFNGNNEVMVANKYWGFKQQYKIDDQTQKEFDENYQRLFLELIPSKINKYTSVPYIHTSPLSHWGKDERYKHGSQHYWGVWHGNDPLEDFARKAGRFNAEYGFQSFPEYSTLLQFSEPKDWDLDSEVMRQHQKSYVGNKMILKHTEKRFGKPENFEDFVYLSQLTQAEAVGMAISSHRLQFPRVTGTIYWQINDCWPVSSWSSIDYYGNWKALHYRVKEDFENSTILRNWTEKGAYSYFLTSDLPNPHYTEVSYRIFDLSGKELYNRPITLEIQLSSQKNIPIVLPKKVKNNTSYLIEFTWKSQEKTFQRSFLHNEKNYKGKTTAIPVKSLKDLGNGKAELTIFTEKFTAYTWVSSLKGGIKIDDNFRHLLPGEHRFILHYDKEIPITKDLKIMGR